MAQAESYTPPYEPLQDHLEFQKGEYGKTMMTDLWRPTVTKSARHFFKKNRLATFRRIRPNVPAEVWDLI